jgi:hypothetical protein
MPSAFAFAIPARRAAGLPSKAFMGFRRSRPDRLASRRLRDLIPELLEANNAVPESPHIPIEITDASADRGEHLDLMSGYTPDVIRILEKAQLPLRPPWQG